MHKTSTGARKNKLQLLIFGPQGASSKQSLPHFRASGGEQKTVTVSPCPSDKVMMEERMMRRQWSIYASARAFRTHAHGKMYAWNGQHARERTHPSTTAAIYFRLSEATEGRSCSTGALALPERRLSADLRVTSKTACAC
eukprot:4084884-Pleurochrysis_carterae.AAC.1